MPLPQPIVPYARTINVMMWSICLVLSAAFMLIFIQWQIHTEDRYENKLLQSRLERGLTWLSSTLQDGNQNENGTPGACPGSEAVARYLCAVNTINERLGKAPVPHHISPYQPPEELRPDVMITIRWLSNNVRDPEKLLSQLRSTPGESVKLSQGDPFRLYGCIYRSIPTTEPARTVLCPEDSPLDASDTPTGMSAIFSRIKLYRAPSRNYPANLYTHQNSPGLVTNLLQGRHVWLGLDQQVHSKAQITASCYTGDSEACQKCPWCNTEGAQAMFEGARARSIGILVVDVKSGAIEAASSAYTECYARQQQGQNAIAACPLLPGSKTAHHFRLDNQAISQTAMPGSETKPLIAVALIKAGLSSKELASLPDIITRSSTEDLIALVMCKEANFDPVCAKHRLSIIDESALAMGWESSLDLLTDREIPSLTHQVFGARLLHDSHNKSMTKERLHLSAEAIKNCYNRPLKERWRQCKGEDFVNTLAELFGQGNSLASPVGIANGLLHIATADNKQLYAPRVHLVSQVQTEQMLPTHVESKHPLIVTTQQVEPVINGMSKTHIRGTAHSACIRAAAMGGNLSCETGGETSIKIASKTGTPVFSGDRQTLSSWRKQCNAVRQELSKTRAGKAQWFHWRNEAGKCEMRPIKWYAFMVSAPGENKWNKVVVVLAERNWNKNTEFVDTSDDIGPNIAAEAGLALANAIYSAKFQSRPPHNDTELQASISDISPGPSL